MRRRKLGMAYVIASTCIDVKDGACQEVCPVECIYEGGRMMYIQPDECIDCGLCLSVCPVDAIYAADDLPESEREFERANAEFFASALTRWLSRRDSSRDSSNLPLQTFLPDFSADFSLGFSAESPSSFAGTGQSDKVSDCQA